MAGTWEFWLTNDQGERLFNLSPVSQCSMIRVASGIGQVTMQLGRAFDTSILHPGNRDYMIQAWRAPEGGSSSLFRVFFLRRWRMWRDQNSRLGVEIGGPDINDLMRRRMVVNYEGTDEANKNDAADNVMKEYVDEQCVNDASDPAPSSGDRQIPDYSIEVSVGLAANFRYAGSWLPLIDVLKDVSDGSRANDVEVFWDIVTLNVGPPIEFQLVTKLDQLGQDRTATAIFDDARGNLQQPEFRYDASEEINYVYVSGDGAAELMESQQVFDTERINVSRYNRCEGPGYAGYSGEDTVIEDSGLSELRNGEPIEEFTSYISDQDSMRFGIDWNFGDKVTAKFLDRTYETIVRKVVITLDGNGREDVQARLEYLASGAV